MDCILREGLDWGRVAVRGDVQIRLLGGAEGLVLRFVRFSVEAVMVKRQRPDQTRPAVAENDSGAKLLIYAGRTESNFVLLVRRVNTV